MYIRDPEKKKWIQGWLNKNDNHPVFSVNQKKHILKKLVQKHLKLFYTPNMLVKKDFHLKEVNL